jgi:hypothetical protein
MSLQVKERTKMKLPTVNLTPPEQAGLNDLDARRAPRQDTHGGHGGHGWMMIACCIPILVIAIVLVATGVAGVGFIFAAVMCTAMMAMMMRMMSSGGGGDHEGH